MSKEMATQVGRLSGWGLLLVALSCSGESAVVGVNEEEAAGPAGSNDAQVSGTSTRYVTPISDDPGLCLPTPLPVEDDGTASCKIFTTTVSSTCTCEAVNRAPVSASQRDAVRHYAAQYSYCDEPGGPACEDLCVCENLEAVGDARTACLTEESSAADGWCYVAPDQGIGSPDLVAECTEDLRAKVRFMNGARLGTDRSYLACSDPAPTSPQRAPLGAVCVPSNEADPSFGSFREDEVTIDVGSPDCASGVCLVQQFQGRVSCPFGNRPLEGGGFSTSCLTPGTRRVVTVGVQPQWVSTPPSLGSTCSCRCAGKGAGPFCDCGATLQCVPMIDALGLGDDAYAGSYCVPPGAVPALAHGIDTCVDDPPACREDRPQ